LLLSPSALPLPTLFPLLTVIWSGVHRTRSLALLALPLVTLWLLLLLLLLAHLILLLAVLLTLR
jgi:hypothetical protein